MNSSFIKVIEEVETKSNGDYEIIEYPPAMKKELRFQEIAVKTMRTKKKVLRELDTRIQKSYVFIRSQYKLNYIPNGFPIGKLLLEVNDLVKLASKKTIKKRTKKLLRKQLKKCGKYTDKEIKNIINKEIKKMNKN